MIDSQQELQNFIFVNSNKVSLEGGNNNMLVGGNRMGAERRKSGVQETSARDEGNPSTEDDRLDVGVRHRAKQNYLKLLTNNSTLIDSHILLVQLLGCSLKHISGDHFYR